MWVFDGLHLTNTHTFTLNSVTSKNKNLSDPCGELLERYQYVPKYQAAAPAG